MRLLQVASRLSCLVERTGDNTEDHRNVRTVLVAFYADYMRKLSSGQLKSLSTADVPKESILRVTLQSAKQPRVQFEVAGDVVAAVMELLCESFDAEKVRGGERYDKVKCTPCRPRIAATTAESTSCAYGSRPRTRASSR